MAKSYAVRNAESIAKYGKTLYQRRIESGLAKGKTRTEARGSHAKTEAKKQQAKTPLYTSRKPGTIYVHGKQQAGTRFERERHIDVPATPAQAKKYDDFLKAGKPKTAKRYLLAEVYQTPVLAGGEYLEGWDYDLEQPMQGIFLDELFGDEYDVGDFHSKYAIE